MKEPLVLHLPSLFNICKLVLQALKEQQVFLGDEIAQFFGFYSPEEAGVYKMRMYFEELADFTAADQMYLAYVHRGERDFGLDDSWVKIIEITPDLK